MGFEHMPGAKVIILNGDFQPVGEVEIYCYHDKDKRYSVWWTYPQTGGRELIKVPEWRLIKKKKHALF